ncbi:MAG: sensor histidine kinase [Gammaproteobacteria bacterium]|uniref:sensor histidine kinase n=1 Tax=Azohydromonas sp. TaxID=1872666 RepID=UPI002BD3CCF0|nr:sensor histidine kinase [Azohydromonas sp.]HMM86035.1 sensor histidine kinase [Azohydromonas sp.]
MNATSPPPSPPAPPAAPASPGRWQHAGGALVRGFHAYANWLVGISWKRFIVLSVLLLIVVNIVAEIPPFSWTVSETVTERPPRAAAVKPPPAPLPPAPPAPAGDREPLIKIERPGRDGDGVEISIGEKGIRIKPSARSAGGASGDAAARAAEAASAAETAAAQAASAAEAASGIEIRLPPGTSEAVREAVEEVRREVLDAAEEARRDAEEAVRDAERAVREAGEAAKEAARDAAPRIRVTKVRLGDFLPDLALIWIFGSMILKITYKGRMQAEVKAAMATETAEAEQLKRQLVEARMAAMQAQVEPHFLFNTLASIDHLIETDPPRASQMQKHLIALLRASMPTMRETQVGAVRELGREMAVIRPYLEILKMRMEDRLQLDTCVPAGLLTAEFPPMMLQTLVENAIKHGLEPKPEGGTLRVCAEVVDGRLEVTVADTGVGFGAADTAGTGVGLENIRERLRLLYGSRASLTMAAQPGGGTVATIAVPYVARARAEGGEA